MVNLLLELEFDGRDFFGWQRQPKKRTVQGKVEEVLKRIYETEVKVNGVGRLDRGVSALSFFANFHPPKRLPLANLKRALNALLSRDIYVKRIKEVREDFSARRAKSKTYEYSILLGRSPLRRDKVWELEYPTSVEKIKEAASLFLGKRDFAHFVKRRLSGICEVKEIKVLAKGREIKIRIEGDRFLYKMVRRIVGTLVDFARGKIEREDIVKALEEKPHRPFTTAPPQGLCLIRVRY